MKLLIKNGNLISMSKERDKIEYGMDILIQDKNIIKIAKNINDKVDKVIDATEKVVMPGLIDTHAHISMSVFRETVDGLNTWDWLNQEIWPMEDKLTNDDIYWASLLSCLEMISCGCTTINDMYFMTDDIIRAVVDSGVRLETTRCLIGYDSNDESRFNELRRLIPQYSDVDTVTFNCGIHGFYTSSLPYIRKCVSFAKDNNLKIHIHFCEDQNERETIQKNYSIENPALLIKDEFMGIHNILGHVVKVSDDDIEVLKDTNSYVAHCPISNLKLGCGVAPVVKMMDKGICVALGTDGQGSGCNLDMFQVMKFTALLQKGILENSVVMDSYTVLQMATVNGAKALNLSKIGHIDVGMLADIIIVDSNTLINQPINNVFANLVYNTNGSDVVTTIVNGKVLMEDRIINNISVDEVKNKCSEIIKRIRG